MQFSFLWIGWTSCVFYTEFFKIFCTKHFVRYIRAKYAFYQPLNIFYHSLNVKTIFIHIYLSFIEYRLTEQDCQYIVRFKLNWAYVYGSIIKRYNLHIKSFFSFSTYFPNITLKAFDKRKTFLFKFKCFYKV